MDYDFKYGYDIGSISLSHGQKKRISFKLLFTGNFRNKNISLLLIFSG